MFESKKWLIWIFALTLVGSVGGSLIAFFLMQKTKSPAIAAAPPQVEKTETAEPIVPVTPPTNEPVPVAAKEPESVKPSIDENLQPTFPIVSRADWKAHKPVLEMKEHVPSIISIHHTATTPQPDKGVEGKVRGLQDFSQHEGKISTGKSKPVWPDLPYHFYIDVNGKVAEGCEIQYVGDTNPEYDSTGQILIALEGNFEKTEPTREQMEVLFKMVAWLSNKYKIPADKITSHKAFMTTACPGKNLEARLDEIRQFAWKK